MEVDINRVTGNAEKALINKIAEILPHLTEQAFEAYRSRRPPDDGAPTLVSSENDVANDAQLLEPEEVPPLEPYLSYDEEAFYEDFGAHIDFLDPSVLEGSLGTGSTILPTS